MSRVGHTSGVIEGAHLSTLYLEGRTVGSGSHEAMVAAARLFVSVKMPPRLPGGFDEADG